MAADLPKRTWAEIDPSALAHNAGVARAMSDGAAVMAVVKADGYGHGLNEATRALLSEVDAFGVATLREALEVREITGPEVPVMVLGALLPDERETALRADLSVTISSLDEAIAYSELADELGTKARAHLVLDTGMGRVGFLEPDFAAEGAALAALGGLELEGVATHFPSADEDPVFTEAQIERFAATCATEGITTRWKHLSNSAGILAFGAAGGDLVRPGLMLYGVSPLPEHADKLRPALAWRVRITQVRDLPAGAGVSYGRRFVTEHPTRVATLAVGYGDGYPRHLSGSGAAVLIAGQRCPILGRVTMDQIMVDTNALDLAPAPGDIATLLGADGEELITAAELAEQAGTIPWEILTGIMPRVKRVTA